MTDRDAQAHQAERAPGDESPVEEARSGGVRGLLLGFALALGLTFMSFGVVAYEIVWPPAVPAALVALAIAQMGVHLVFFLHMTSGPDNTNNSVALAFGVLVTLLLVFGSVWIMTHLDDRLMPMDEMMRRMR